jgi:hypothetical protein
MSKLRLRKVAPSIRIIHLVMEQKLNSGALGIASYQGGWPRVAEETQYWLDVSWDIISMS